MAKNIGELSVKLTAETEKFKSQLKSAETAVGGFSTRIAGFAAAAGTVATGVGIVATAAVAAGGAVLSMARDVATSAKEIQNLSRVANTGVEEFQRMAYGAQQFGIEQDKLSDILKDVTEKTGEYLATGGGGMKDFFEQIAPAVGVTAEQFRGLSGPQALGLYISTLEKAGVSQDKMTFYLEALASDATMLLPLMRDNGKALQEFGDHAENIGRVMSEMEINQLAKLKQPLDDLASAGNTLKNELIIELLPEIQKFTDWISDPDTIQSAKDLARAVIQFGQDVIAVSKDLAESIPFYAQWKWIMSDSTEEAERFSNGFEEHSKQVANSLAKLRGEQLPYPKITATTKDAVKAMQDLEIAHKEVLRLQEKAKYGWDFTTGMSNEQALEQALARREKALKRAKEIQQELVSGGSGNEPKPTQDISIKPPSKEDTEAQREAEKLRERQAELFRRASEATRELYYETNNLTQAERELAELQYNEDYQKMDAASKLALQARIEERIEIEAVIEADQKRKELIKEINAELADTPLGLLRAEADYRKEIANWLDQGLIDLQEYIALSEKADESFKPEEKADEYAILSTVAADAARTMASDFIDFAKSADQSFEDFAKNFLANIAEMIAQAILFNAIQEAGTAMSGSSNGLIKAIGTAITGSANGNVFSGGSLVPFANGGIVGSPTFFPMTNGTGLMGEAGPEAIMPLTRINGRLGVQATGLSTNNTQINNVNVTVQGGNSNDQTGAAVADAVMRAIARQEISNAQRVGGLNNPVRQGI